MVDFMRFSALMSSNISMAPSSFVSSAARSGMTLTLTERLTPLSVNWASGKKPVSPEALAEEMLSANQCPASSSSAVSGRPTSASSLDSQMRNPAPLQVTILSVASSVITAFDMLCRMLSL